jgi:hypothetical protein
LFGDSKRISDEATNSVASGQKTGHHGLIGFAAADVMGLRLIFSMILTTWS